MQLSNWNSIYTNYAPKYGVEVRNFNLEFQNKEEIKTRQWERSGKVDSP
jgi:hypothetical protein